MLRQSFFLPFGVKTLATTATSHGITQKFLLLGTLSDQVGASECVAHLTLCYLCLMWFLQDHMHYLSSMGEAASQVCDLCWKDFVKACTDDTDAWPTMTGWLPMSRCT